MYNDQDFMDFVKYVYTNYETTEMDVSKMVMEEHITNIRGSSIRNTRNNRIRLLNDTLANCRAWLAQERKPVTPVDLVMYRPAKLFFNLIQKRETGE